MSAWIERERAISIWMHGASTRAWVLRLPIPISRVGDGWLWYLVVVCLPWAGGSAGPSAAIRMFCVGAVDIVVYKIIKRWIARARPCHACASIRACVPSLDEFSFPSGHMLHSVACSVVLSAYYPAVAFFVWPFAVLVGISRIVLGLHFPSDVLVGALIGALIGATTAVVSFNLL